MDGKYIESFYMHTNDFIYHFLFRKSASLRLQWAFPLDLKVVALEVFQGANLPGSDLLCSLFLAAGTAR